jgi:hypothetical protein
MAPLSENGIGFYQEAFTIPGRSPLDAISRKQRRDILNLRKNPRDLPVNWHRLRRRVLEESLGILLRASTAASLSSIDLLISMIAFFKACRFSHFNCTCLSRRCCFATEDDFAMNIPLLFFSSRPFLALLSIGIFSVNHIDSTSSANDFVPFRRVSLDGCSYFHLIL